MFVIATIEAGPDPMAPLRYDEKDTDMVYVVGGAIAVGLIGYGVYKAAEYAGKIHQHEAEHAGADGGS